MRDRDPVELVDSIPEDEDLQRMLETKIETYDLDEEHTLREYFKALLTELWTEEECFSGKRPFGNSGWQYDVYASLISAGHMVGTLDEDGYVDEFDQEKAQALILDLIKAL